MEIIRDETNKFLLGKQTLIYDIETEAFFTVSSVDRSDAGVNKTFIKLSNAFADYTSSLELWSRTPSDHKQVLQDIVDGKITSNDFNFLDLVLKR